MQDGLERDLKRSKADPLRRRQGRYWLLTIPIESWEPCLPEGCAYVKGQGERGRGCVCGYTEEHCTCPEDRKRYKHWQVLFVLDKKGSLATIRRMLGFDGFHGELTRSEAADEYVWKEDTRIPGSQFEFGEKKVRVNNKVDWDEIWELAKAGRIEEIPAGVRIRCYNTLEKISLAYAEPTAILRRCVVYWGKTGTGKTRRAWNEAGMGSYPKNPRTKWWDSYRGQKNVIIDEFRGGIDITYFLQWTDRYPVLVERKGGGCPLEVESIWVTSNLHPKRWWPDMDPETLDALYRKVEIYEVVDEDGEQKLVPDDNEWMMRKLGQEAREKIELMSSSKYCSNCEYRFTDDGLCGCVTEMKLKEECDRINARIEWCTKYNRCYHCSGELDENDDCDCKRKKFDCRNDIMVWENDECKIYAKKDLDDYEL